MIPLALVLIIAIVVGSALLLASPHGRTLLRRFAWFRGLERLEPRELRHYGMISIGIGICWFAALLTLRLLGPVPLGVAVTLAGLAVVTITLGAALLERAGYLSE